MLDKLDVVNVDFVVVAEIAPKRIVTEIIHVTASSPSVVVTYVIDVHVGAGDRSLLNTFIRGCNE